MLANLCPFLKILWGKMLYFDTVFNFRVKTVVNLRPHRLKLSQIVIGHNEIVECEMVVLLAINYVFSYPFALIRIGYKESQAPSSPLQRARVAVAHTSGYQIPHSRFFEFA